MAYTDYQLKVAFRQMLIRSGFSTDDAFAAAKELVDTILPVSIVTSGSIEAGTTVTAGTGITATAGAITATAGAVAAGTTVTGGTGVVATTGGVTASAGSITATTGDVVASAGTVTGATGVIATTGGVTATAGGVIATAGGVTATAGGVTATAGGVTATAGGVLVGTNALVDTTDEIQVIDGDVSIIDTAAVGEEVLNETAFATHAKWDATGEMTDSGGKLEYTFAASGVGTATQTEANQVVKANILPNHWYKFVYTVDITVAPSSQGCTLTTGVAASAQTLDITAGAGKVLYFKSAAAPANFVIDVTGLTAGQFGIDDVSLKPVVGGDITAHGVIDCGCFAVASRRITSVGGALEVNDVNVAGIGCLILETAGGDITIGSFAGGVEGQVVWLLCTEATNDVILEDDEGGTQDFKTVSGADTTIHNNKIGATAVICDGTNWFEVGATAVFA